MEETVNIDKQGRLVIPVHLRECLGVSEGGEVFIRVEGGRLVIEPIQEDLEKKVGMWVRLAKRESAQAMSERTPLSWKWMSEDYATKKIRLN